MEVQKQLQPVKRNSKTFSILFWINIKYLFKYKALWILTPIILVVNILFQWRFSYISQGDYYLLGNYITNNSLILFNLILLNLWMFFVCSKLFAGKASSDLMQMELRYGYNYKNMFFIRVLVITIAAWCLLLLLTIQSLFFLKSSSEHNYWYFNFIIKYYLWSTLTLISTSFILIFLLFLWKVKYTAIFWIPMIVILPSVGYLKSSMVQNKLYKNLNNSEIISKINAEVDFGYQLYERFYLDKNVQEIFNVKDFEKNINELFTLENNNFYNLSIKNSDLYSIFYRGESLKTNPEDNVAYLQTLNPKLFEIIYEFAELTAQNSPENDAYNALFDPEKNTDKKELPPTSWLTNLLEKDKDFSAKYKNLFLYLDEYKSFYFNLLHINYMNDVISTEDFSKNHSEYRVYVSVLTKAWIYAMQNPFTSTKIQINKKGPTLDPNYGMHEITYEDYAKISKLGIMASIFDPFNWNQARMIPVEKNSFKNDAILNQFNSLFIYSSWNLKNIKQEFNTFQEDKEDKSGFNFDINESYFKEQKITPNSNNLVLLQVILALSSFTIGALALCFAFIVFRRKIVYAD